MQEEKTCEKCGKTYWGVNPWYCLDCQIKPKYLEDEEEDEE